MICLLQWRVILDTQLLAVLLLYYNALLEFLSTAAT